MHPNRLPFEGVLAVVDRPSDDAPAGARCHRVNLTRRAAEEAIPGLIGMGINCNENWDHHDVRRKIGVITDAEIVGDELRVLGYVFAMDCPEITAGLTGELRGKLGMSYEGSACRVSDMRANVWEIVHLTFTGAAVLLREKAAYRSTRFRLVQWPSEAEGAAPELVELRAVCTPQQAELAGDPGVCDASEAR